MGAMQKVIAAFSEEHAERLTGITRSQLRYWDRTRFYIPSYAEDDRSIAFSRVYSFRDIVALRVLNLLRNDHHVSLPHLRKVREKLGHLAEERWTGIKLYVFNKRVVWHEPGTKKPQEVLSGQYVVEVALQVIIADTKRDVEKLNRRDDSQHGVIVRSRFVSHNTPVLAGTRIPVNAIKRFAEAGYNTAKILKEYPDLTEKDVEAALAYESRVAA